MIAIYEPDYLSLKQLNKMLKKMLPAYKCQSFTSLEECVRYVEGGNADIVFLDVDSLMPLFRLQLLVYQLRNKHSRLDFVLLTSTELSEQTAIWSINTQVSSYMKRPYQPNDLVDTLTHIWYHKIPDSDLQAS